MKISDRFKGLSCPRCGGMIQIPEGFSIVTCQFCDLRSVVNGNNGIRRYQVPEKITREFALQTWKKFLGSSLAIARHTKNRAKLTDVFLVHIPFWNVTGKGLGWGFGKKQVGSGENRRYVPKELRAVEVLNWNRAACDVGEFGVNQVLIADRPIMPFDPNKLHQSGMVFEPVGSTSETLLAANQFFENRLNSKLSLDRQTQLFFRIVKPILSLVYYPLWVIRFTVSGRAFQVVIDGYSGEVLYGKAPGSVAFRSAALILGMAAGSFLAIDISAFLLRVSNEINPIALLFTLGGGLALMALGWRIFRYSEHYEYQRYKSNNKNFDDLILSLPTEARELLDTARKTGVFNR